MKLLPKISLTLTTLTVLGLTGTGSVYAGTVISNVAPVLNQPDVTKVGTDGYYLYNFLSPGGLMGTTTGTDEFGIKSSAVNYLSSQNDLTTLSSNTLGGNPAYAPTTNPNGYLGIGYLEAAGQVAKFTVKANVPASFNVAYVIDGFIAPPSIALADTNSPIDPVTKTFSIASAQNTKVINGEEVDYYLFNIAGAVNGETFTFYATPSSGNTDISGLAFATVPETSSSVGLGILLSIGGLAIFLRKRAGRA